MFGTGGTGSRCNVTMLPGFAAPCHVHVHVHVHENDSNLGPGWIVRGLPEFAWLSWTWTWTVLDVDVDVDVGESRP